MQVFTPCPESYFEFTEKLSAGCDTEVFPFQTVDQAVFDLCSALALTYSHKMSIAVVENTGPFFHRISVHFSRLGYNVQTYKMNSNESVSESLDDWLAGLKKDTLFVLADLDDVFTGQLFDLSNILAEFEKKKIFQIVLSHSVHRCRAPSDPTDFEISVRQTRSGRVVAFLGSRAKVLPVHVLSLDWSKENTENYALATVLTEEKTRVEKLEAALPAGAKAYFSFDSSRIFDRAVLYWQDVDGYSLADEVCRALGEEMKDVGEEKRIEATSLCRWNFLSDFHWIGDFAQGLVVFSAEMIDDKTPTVIAEAHARVLQIQNG